MFLLISCPPYFFLFLVMHTLSCQKYEGKWALMCAFQPSSFSLFMMDFRIRLLMEI